MKNEGNAYHQDYYNQAIPLKQIYCSMLDPNFIKQNNKF